MLIEVIVFKVWPISLTIERKGGGAMKFDFQDIIYFGLFILALLTYIDQVYKRK